MLHFFPPCVPKSTGRPIAASASTSRTHLGRLLLPGCQRTVLQPRPPCSRLPVQDLFANGGVFVGSFFEWTQNISSMQWEEEEVTQRLDT